MADGWWSSRKSLENSFVCPHDGCLVFILFCFDGSGGETSSIHFNIFRYCVQLVWLFIHIKNHCQFLLFVSICFVLRDWNFTTSIEFQLQNVIVANTRNIITIVCIIHTMGDDDRRWRWRRRHNNGAAAVTSAHTQSKSHFIFHLVARQWKSKAKCKKKNYTQSNQYSNRHTRRSLQKQNAHTIRERRTNNVLAKAKN